jgi:hypothetical protein
MLGTGLSVSSGCREWKFDLSRVTLDALPKLEDVGNLTIGIGWVRKRGRVIKFAPKKPRAYQRWTGLPALVSPLAVLLWLSWLQHGCCIRRVRSGCPYERYAGERCGASDSSPAVGFSEAGANGEGTCAAGPRATGPRTHPIARLGFIGAASASTGLRMCVRCGKPFEAKRSTAKYLIVTFAQSRRIA